MPWGSEPWVVAGRCALWCLALAPMVAAQTAPKPASGKPSATKPGAPKPEDTLGVEELRGAARQMARDAIDLMSKGQWADAEDLLRRAQEIVPAPTIALLRGRCLQELGRLVEAADSFEAARQLPSGEEVPAAFRTAAADATVELERLTPQIPRLVITLVGANADDPRLVIKLDDKVVPPRLLEVRRPLDPGQHLVLAEFDGVVHHTRWVTVRRGEEVSVLLRVDAPKEVSPPPPPPPAPTPVAPRSLHRPAAAGLLVLGGVGLLTGVSFGLVMAGHQSQLEEGCRPECPLELEDELHAFRRARAVSAAAYGVGFLGVGLGTVVLVSAPRRRTSVGLAPGSLVLRRSF